MIRNIKEIIVDNARILFMEKGYDSVSMREIAGTCQISVGNLTYHFSRKEDILMELHDVIMNEYIRQIPEKEKKETGLSGYFAAEYAFHRFIAESGPFLRLYRQVINSSSMREMYYQRHHSLYLSYVGPEADSPEGFDSTVVMSALEFHLLETGALEQNFDMTMNKIFQAKLLFLGSTEDSAEVIQKGISAGKRLHQRIDMSKLEAGVVSR